MIVGTLLNAVAQEAVETVAQEAGSGIFMTAVKAGAGVAIGAGTFFVGYKVVKGGLQLAVTGVWWTKGKFDAFVAKDEDKLAA